MTVGALTPAANMAGFTHAAIATTLVSTLRRMQHPINVCMHNIKLEENFQLKTRWPQPKQTILCTKAMRELFCLI